MPFIEAHDPRPLQVGTWRCKISDNVQFRFVAVAIGLAIVVALVYWRFVRSSQGGSS